MGNNIFKKLVKYLVFSAILSLAASSCAEAKEFKTYMTSRGEKLFTTMP